MLLHVRAEISEKFHLFTQGSWMLIHSVIQLISIAFNVLNGPIAMVVVSNKVLILNSINSYFASTNSKSFVKSLKMTPIVSSLSW